MTSFIESERVKVVNPYSKRHNLTATVIKPKNDRPIESQIDGGVCLEFDRDGFIMRIPRQFLVRLSNSTEVDKKESHISYPVFIVACEKDESIETALEYSHQWRIADDESDIQDMVSDRPIDCHTFYIFQLSEFKRCHPQFSLNVEE